MHCFAYFTVYFHSLKICIYEELEHFLHSIFTTYVYSIVIQKLKLRHYWVICNSFWYRFFYCCTVIKFIVNYFTLIFYIPFRNLETLSDIIVKILMPVINNLSDIQKEVLKSLLPVSKSIQMNIKRPWNWTLTM